MAPVVTALMMTMGSPCVGACKLLRRVPACKARTVWILNLDAMIPPRKSSDRYVPPDLEAAAALQESIELAARGKPRAFNMALAAGYVLCANRREGVLIWQPALPGTGWALVALRARSARPLVLEVPHPVYDLVTFDQALHAFEEVSARALLVSAVHRCANADYSTCGGVTRVCSRRFERYRESDVAHSPMSMFQFIHRGLSNAYPEDVIISLHGMSNAGLSVSDGTTIPTSTTSPIARLAGAFSTAFPSEPVLLCNQPHGVEAGDDDDDHLCGTSNIQGRYTNGVTPDVCAATATTSSQRFIHLEQSPAVRSMYRRVVEVLDDFIP